jgi:UDP-N-acetylmuramoyl-tripeptide--D-alanyl-D-alanine ligase
MKTIDAATAAAWSGGSLAAGPASTAISAVSTDTRRITLGSLFVALAGDRFDAHDFMDAAAQGGAAAVMVHRDVTVPAGMAVIRVSDTLTGMQRMAAAWRREWQGMVVGLTGSNGKTSTKDMTRAVLAQKYRTSATAGNLNNHIGVPLTLLAIQSDQEAAVVEMGMNHAGEIAPLAAMAAPQTGIITNIGTAHIEFLGSRENIAREKAALAESIPASGTVILNATDDFTPLIRSLCSAHVITAGVGSGDIRVENLACGPAGSQFQLRFPSGESVDVSLPVPGRHMAANAALAAAAGWTHGIAPDAIGHGLASLELTAGRVQLRTAAGLQFLDDSYNANPDSMKAALETLRSLTCRGRRIAVLGRMGELGPHSEQGHRETGAAARATAVDLLFLVESGDVPHIAEGFLAAGGDPATLRRFPDHAACAEALRSAAGPDDIILLKGSRSAGMERVPQLLSGS